MDFIYIWLIKIDIIKHDRPVKGQANVISVDNCIEQQLVKQKNSFSS